MDSQVKEADKIELDHDLMISIDGEISSIKQAIKPNPIMWALEAIGTLLGIKFYSPKPDEQLELEEIAYLSNVNYRQLTLQNRWWQEDHGVMLGFKHLDGNLHPVVLKPNNQGGYSLLVPDSLSEILVDETVAAYLASHAFIFYRKLPAKSHVSKYDLIHFLLHGRRWDVALLVFTTLLIISTGLFIPVATNLLFAYVIPSRDLNLYSQLMIGLALIYLCRTVFLSIREYAVLKVETCLNHDLEAALWDRVLNMPMNFFRQFTVGDLMQRISIVGEIRQTLTSQFIEVAIDGLFSLLYLFIMFYYSPQLTLVALAFIGLSCLMTMIGYVAIKNKAVHYLAGIIQGKVVQMIMGLSKIRTNGAEQRIFRYWAQDALLNQRLKYQMGRLSYQITTIDGAIEGFKYIAIFLVVIGWISLSQSSGISILTVASYLAFSVALTNFSTAISQLNSTILQMPNLYAMWNYSKILLQHPLEDGVNKEKPEKLTGAIHLDHVSFRYEKSGPWIHDNLSLKINPGEFIAIVGPSGCGKSSLLRILLGFEVCERGAIYYDDKDLSTLCLRDVRRQIHSVLQNSRIMDGTILDNITSGVPYPTEKVMKAIHLAGFDRDLDAFPMGLHTVLTSGGTTISGGQKQRLFLARSFLNEAPIIFWDEATAGLDNKMQELVMKNLENIKATRLVIAHRLTAVKNADRIYVLNEGKVVESGTFQELAMSNGLFSEMLSRQKL